MDKIKSTTWIAVNNNLDFTEYDSMESALKSSPFMMFFERVGVWVNGGYHNSAYEMEFFNNQGLKTDGIPLNNWRLFDLSIQSGSSSYSGLWLIVRLWILGVLQ